MTEEKTQEKSGGALQVIEKIKNYIESRGTHIGIAFILLVGLCIGGLFFKKKYIPNKELEAQKAMYMAQFAFEKGQYEMALYGDEQGNAGFQEISEDCHFTKAKNLSNYYAGISALHLGKHQEAIRYLKKFSTKDPIIGAMALGAIGDAYMELDEYKKGIKFYKKAATHSDNTFTSPLFLNKLAMAYDFNGERKNALKYFRLIEDKYPKSDEAKDAPKYIAKLEAES